MSSSRGLGRRGVSGAQCPWTRRYHPPTRHQRRRRHRPSAAGTRRGRCQWRRWTRRRCVRRWTAPVTMSRSPAAAMIQCTTARCVPCLSRARALRASPPPAATAHASTVCAATSPSRSWRVASTSSVRPAPNDFTRTTCAVYWAATARTSWPSTRSLHCGGC